MRKHLYFICPTDHLEPVIESTFHEENYFCSSLGNSISFDHMMMEEINQLIETKNIREITFVLSDSNKLFKEALNNQVHKAGNSLEEFFHDIKNQKKLTSVIWKKSDLQLPVLSLYLDRRIRELQSQISFWFEDKVKINAKVYNRQKKVFKDIHSELFSLKYYSQN
ncbi:hypothetical protein [Flammeovirga sp. SJP92]|uniref:hypothetical protein n=1 Tax=Flammeovirga sp. SJP92 TaxID=1775430 RepID=UPI000799D2E0|nr:hypothetical protein [Flammeovirga sp. SJP92]KXX69957.1 hypothetical protein AVL50_13860 [Flammeovirga sp. SJP92]